MEWISGGEVDRIGVARHVGPIRHIECDSVCAVVTGSSQVGRIRQIEVRKIDLQYKGITGAATIGGLNRLGRLGDGTRWRLGSSWKIPRVGLAGNPQTDSICHSGGRNGIGFIVARPADIDRGDR